MADPEQDLDAQKGPRAGHAQLWVNTATQPTEAPDAMARLFARLALPRVDSIGSRNAGEHRGTPSAHRRAWLLAADSATAIPLSPGNNPLQELSLGAHQLFVSDHALRLIPSREQDDIAEVNGDRCLVPTELKDGALLRLNGRPFRVGVSP